MTTLEEIHSTKRIGDMATREPHKFDPQFKGPLKNRSCTDILCLFVFVAFIAGWIVVAVFAFMHGNPDRLILPTDSFGRICGKNELKDRKYLFFFDLTRCFRPNFKTDEGLKLKLGCDTPQVCVEQCPNTTFSTWYYINGKGKSDLEEEVKEKLICKDGTDRKRALRDLVESNDCAAYYIKSTSLAGRCIPVGLSKIKTIIDELNNETMKDVDVHGLINGSNALAKFMNAREIGELIFQDFKATWPFMIAGLFLSMFVAFSWIILMRWIAGVMVWLSIISLIGLFSYGSYFSFNKYVKLKGVPGSDAELEFTTNLSTYTSLRKTWLILGIIAAVVLVILVLILLFLRKRIRIAIALIKEASKAVGYMPSALFFPLLPYLLHIIVFVFWGTVAVFLASTGEASYVAKNLPNNETRPCNPNDFNETILNDRGLENATCVFQQYDSDKNLLRSQIYNLVGLIWCMFFIVGVGQVALAGAFSSYYWAFNKPKDIPFFGVLNGLYIVTRYHLGSVAFGSLLLTIVRLIRLVLEYIDRKVKKYDNAFTKAIMCCCKCCFYCLEKFLKFLNKNAYIMIAVYGKNFCASAKEAFNLLMRNIVRVVVLDKVTDFLLLIGKLVIVGAIAVLSFFVFSGEWKQTRDYVPETNYYLLPVIAITVGAYIIASSFFSVYGMAVDTLFLCFLEDCERNDGTPEKPYYMSKELMKILGKMNKFADGKDK